jgi:hypothetical protein
MQVHVSKKGIEVVKPNIEYVNGKPKVLGSCWVKGSSLDCYGWEDEEQLLILDKIPGDPDKIPEDQYFVWNPYRNEYGWVLKHQITFELSSLFGEPYKVSEI